MDTCPNLDINVLGELSLSVHRNYESAFRSVYRGAEDRPIYGSQRARNLNLVAR